MGQIWPCAVKTQLGFSISPKLNCGFFFFFYFGGGLLRQKFGLFFMPNFFFKVITPPAADPGRGNPFLVVLCVQVFLFNVANFVTLKIWNLWVFFYLLIKPPFFFSMVKILQPQFKNNFLKNLWFYPQGAFFFFNQGNFNPRGGASPQGAPLFFSRLRFKEFFFPNPPKFVGGEKIPPPQGIRGIFI